MPSTEVFEDLDQGQDLLGSLHLEADDEPIRRGVASRANSVRFDESALQGSSWGGQGARHSGEFAPARPSSGMGNPAMMERSFSHKSDGRHSSAGHSVHSMHSGVSGRASSLGLDTNFIIGGRDDDSPLDIPEPPPGFFILGSVPSIIRCWLNTNFAYGTLLYAAVCTGSQTSTVDFSLLKELNLTDDIERDVDGVRRIRLPVYFAEARVTQSNSRSPSPAPQLPNIHATFQVTNVDDTDANARGKIRVFIGSDTLRLHSADILFSQNIMTLYGNDRDKLSIPFVRPEDDTVFKHLTTAHVVPGKLKLNAAAREFISTENPAGSDAAHSTDPAPTLLKNGEVDPQAMLSPTGGQMSQTRKLPPRSPASESGAENERQHASEPSVSEVPGRDNVGHSDNNSRRDSSSAIWGPWRQGASGSGGDGPRENGPLSGYQPAGRASRGMKVLKASKSGGGERRRKSQAGTSTTAAAETGSGSGSGGGSVRWDSGRSVSGSASGTTANSGWSNKSSSQTANSDTSGKGSTASAPRSANNPLGNASAFASWMGHGSKSKPPTTTAAE